MPATRLTGARAEPTSRSEVAFLVAAAQALAVTALLTVPLAYVLAGGPGALGAAAALAFLVLLFGLSSLLHLVAAPHGRDVWLLLTVGGLGLRLVLYFVLVRALADVAALHATALGLSAAAGIVIGQVFEIRALGRARAHDVVHAGPARSATWPGGAEGPEQGVEE